MFKSVWFQSNCCFSFLSECAYTFTCWCSDGHVTFDPRTTQVRSGKLVIVCPRLTLVSNSQKDYVTYLHVRHQRKKRPIWLRRRSYVVETCTRHPYGCCAPVSLLFLLYTGRVTELETFLELMECLLVFRFFVSDLPNTYIHKSTQIIGLCRTPLSSFLDSVC
jgi:uncharacterized C2H2 Zn-finger protein